MDEFFTFEIVGAQLKPAEPPNTAATTKNDRLVSFSVELPNGQKCEAKRRVYLAKGYASLTPLVPGTLLKAAMEDLCRRYPENFWGFQAVPYDEKVTRNSQKVYKPRLPADYPALAPPLTPQAYFCKNAVSTPSTAGMTRDKVWEKLVAEQRRPWEEAWAKAQEEYKAKVAACEATEEYKAYLVGLEEFEERVVRVQNTLFRKFRIRFGNDTRFAATLDIWPKSKFYTVQIYCRQLTDQAVFDQHLDLFIDLLNLASRHVAPAAAAQQQQEAWMMVVEEEEKTEGGRKKKKKKSDASTTNPVTTTNNDNDIPSFSWRSYPTISNVCGEVQLPCAISFDKIYQWDEDDIRTSDREYSFNPGTSSMTVTFPHPRPPAAATNHKKKKKNDDGDRKAKAQIFMLPTSTKINETGCPSMDAFDHDCQIIIRNCFTTWFKPQPSAASTLTAPSAKAPGALGASRATAVPINHKRKKPSTQAKFAGIKQPLDREAEFWDKHPRYAKPKGYVRPVTMEKRRENKAKAQLEETKKAKKTLKDDKTKKKSLVVDLPSGPRPPTKMTIVSPPLPTSPTSRQVFLVGCFVFVLLICCDTRLPPPTRTTRTRSGQPNNQRRRRKKRRRTSKPSRKTEPRRTTT